MLNRILVGGDPLNRIDPFGTIEICTPWIPTWGTMWHESGYTLPGYNKVPSQELIKLIVAIRTEGYTNGEDGYAAGVISELFNYYWKYTRYEIYETRRYIKSCINVIIGECGSKVVGPYTKEEYRTTGNKGWLKRDFQIVPDSEIPDEYKYNNPYYDPQPT